MPAMWNFGRSRGIKTNRASAILFSPGEALTVTTSSCSQRKEAVDEPKAPLNTEEVLREADKGSPRHGLF